MDISSAAINEREQKKLQDTLSLLNLQKTRGVREMRDLILRLEIAMKAMPDAMTAEDFFTKHHFEPGIYMRELFIPKDTILTGKIHKTAHLNILSQGKLTVWTEDGMKTLTASTTIRSLPGIKRVGYAHEDSVWITVHHNPTDERDLKKVEARLVADTFDEAYLTSQRTLQDVIQYAGFSAEEMKLLSEMEWDQIPFPVKPDNIWVGPSPIHGQGVFATKRIKPGQVITHARVQGKRTPVGRFCNHSGDPNAEMVMRDNEDVVLIALKYIEAGQEILNDYYLSYINTRPGSRNEIMERNPLCHLSVLE